MPEATAHAQVGEINGRIKPKGFSVRIVGLDEGAHEYKYQFYDLVGDRKDRLGKRRWKVTGRKKLWKYVAGIEEGRKK